MDHTVVAADPPPPQASNPVPANYSNGLSFPPIDASFFRQGDDDGLNFNHEDNDVVLDDFDMNFDFSFDDLLPASLSPPSQPQQTTFDSNCFFLPGSDPDLPHFFPDRSLKNAFKTTALELTEDFHGDEANLNSSPSTSPDIFQASDEQGMHEVYGDDRGHDVSGYLNMPSPESSDSKASRVFNYPSPESQVSGNFRADASEGSSNKSVNSSPVLGNTCDKNVSIAEEMKLEDSNKSSTPLLKRKKEGENSNNTDSRTNKYQKSAYSLCDNANDSSDNILNDENEKKMNRLMRNRESAQLSRQRKKHYVDELQDKVKSMGVAIQDLNSQIAYVMAENATLRQQLSGGRGPPPPGPTPTPGMYPPHMMYPWMPYGVSPYMMKSHGSQVPLFPIPRLKSQQPTSAPKASKKPGIKKVEMKPERKKVDAKTKKVASVSFLGLLFFLFLFGGLVPMVNIRYGGIGESVSGFINISGSQFNQKHHERVLSASRHVNGVADDGGRIGGDGGLGHNVVNVHHGRGNEGGELINNDHGPQSNGSDPLAASLYVPRNDKLVKIDGNLIIHSVLASERAMASRNDSAKETSTYTRLAVPVDLVPVHQVPGGKQAHLDSNLSEKQRANGAMEESVKKRAAVSSMQQWFREGLAGPMLSSEMCIEVFQFDVSSSIVPATSTQPESVVDGSQKNSTDLSKTGNRRTSGKARILRGLPTSGPGSPHNITNKEEEGRNSQENFTVNNPLSSMVVSVLVDPREVDDIEGNGVMGPKTLSRIFVVVLMDSVKYVTYSCMLPFKGAVSHLVTN